MVNGYEVILSAGFQTRIQSKVSTAGLRCGGQRNERIRCLVAGADVNRIHQTTVLEHLSFLLLPFP